MPNIFAENCIIAFPTIIWHKMVPECEELNRSLLALVKEKQAASEGMQVSNMGGWHSDTDLFAWGGPVDTLLKVIHQAVKEVYSFQMEMPLSDFQMIVRTDGWANVNRPGDYNRLHIHPNSNWSGCYYVDPGDAADKKSGRIEFLDPRNRPALFQTPGTDRDDFFCLTPSAGMLVLFPSWLYHTVSPYTGTRDRVSIAFNTAVRQILDGDGNPISPMGS